MSRRIDHLSNSQRGKSESKKALWICVISKCFKITVCVINLYHSSYFSKSKHLFSSFAKQLTITICYFEIEVFLIIAIYEIAGFVIKDILMTVSLMVQKRITMNF